MPFTQNRMVFIKVPDLVTSSGTYWGEGGRIVHVTDPVLFPIRAASIANFTPTTTKLDGAKS